MTVRWPSLCLVGTASILVACPTSRPPSAPLANSEPPSLAAQPAAKPAAVPAPPLARRIVLASGLVNPAAIAVDRDSVYVSVFDSVVAMPKDGSQPPRKIVPGIMAAASIAIDAANVYLAVNLTNLDLTKNVGAIVKLAKATGRLTTLVPDQPGPMSIVVDETNVYFSDHDRGTIARVPIAGGPSATLVTTPELTDGLGQDATHLYFATAGLLAGISGASRSAGVLYKVPKAGGNPTTLAAQLTLPQDMTVLGDNVYFLSVGEVLRVPRSGGLPKRASLRGPLSDAAALIVYDASLFWATTDTSWGGPATVMMLADGAPPTLVLPGEKSPSGIAVDESAVYLTSMGAGEVVRLAR